MGGKREGDAWQVEQKCGEEKINSTQEEKTGNREEEEREEQEEDRLWVTEDKKESKYIEIRGVTKNRREENAG